MLTKLGIIESFKSEGDGRTICGYANVKNVIDKGNDVVVDGAYVELDESLRTGFLAANHDWSNPIGYFTVLKEDQRGLYFEAYVHDTPDGCKFLTMVRERLAAGKSVGLSIGFGVRKQEPGTFDGRNVRILKEVFVKEVSITLIPMNEDSLVTATKTRADEHLDCKSTLKSYLDRLIELKGLGRGAGWLSDRLAELEALKHEISDCINNLTQEPHHDETQNDEAADEKSDAQPTHPDESTNDDQKADLGAVELAKARAQAALAKTNVRKSTERNRNQSQRA